MVNYCRSLRHPDPLILDPMEFWVQGVSAKLDLW